MAQYILLRIENDDEALRLVQDMKAFPASPLLTPVYENNVYAVVIKTLGESL